jgi:hypothetical protein
MDSLELAPFLKLLNREREIHEYMTAIQNIMNFAGSFDDLLKRRPVIISTGGPGLGKTTFARLALHEFLLLPKHPFFDKEYDKLDFCKNHNMEYRISFAVDLVLKEEISEPVISIAFRLLYEILKYTNVSKKFRNYRTFFGHYGKGYNIDVFQVVQWFKAVCGCRDEEKPLIIINLDEVNMIFKYAEKSAKDYLWTIIHQLLEVTADGLATIVPFVTSTKSIETNDAILSSGCTAVNLVLPLLSITDSQELLFQFYRKCGGKMSKGAIQANANLEHILKLMSGNPRFLEKLFYTLGFEPNLRKWFKTSFLINVEHLVNNPQQNKFLTHVIDLVKKLLIAQYSAAVNRLKSNTAQTPELLGCSLFRIVVNREMKFGERTVGNLEEDGLIFLSKKNHDSEDLSLTIPFIWLLDLYQDYSQPLPSSVQHSINLPIMPILATMKFSLSPDDYEALAIATITIKIQTLMKMKNVKRIQFEELFDGQVSVPQRFPKELEINVPVGEDNSFFKLVFLEHKIDTQDRWDAFLGGEDAKHHLSFLNAGQASSWDSCILSNPPLFLQNKQSTRARSQEQLGRIIHTTTSSTYQPEIDKCIPDLNGVLLIITDKLLEPLPPDVSENVLLLDVSTRKALFGEYIAGYVQLSFSSR